MNSESNLHLLPEGPLPSVFEVAYQRLLPEIQALEGTELAAYTLELSQLTSTIRGAAMKMLPLRDAMAKLPCTNIACLDDLEDAARALLYANMVCVSASKPPAALVELGERGAALRTRLYTDAGALTGRDLIDDEAMKTYRGLVGYRVIAMDLILLAGVLERAWSKISGKTAITRAELAEAYGLADALGAAVGERDQSPARAAEAQRMRLLAYNLLLNRYDAARRAVTYLRWDEHDADAFAPSPYAGRGNGNHKKAEPEEAPKPAKDAEPAEKIAPEDNPFGA